ncbi:hypothetical protein IF650_09200 [Cellulosimicrobium terreum]|nr:hypothetical protein [Cellulosimicrobium terreum]
MSDASTETTAPARTSPRRGGGWVRWTACGILLLLGGVLALATQVARYADGTLLDTDRYVAIVAPHQVVERVVGSEAFSRVWESVNRAGHRAVVYVATGEGDVVRASEDGVVRLSLGPVVDEVRTELQDRGFSFAERIPELDPQLTLGAFPQVTVVQVGVEWLARAAAWLPWVVVALAAAAVWVAPARRRGVALVGGTWAAAGLLLVGAVAFGRGKYLDALPPAVAENATGVVYDRLLGPLRADGIWLVVVGVVVVGAVVAWHVWSGGRDGRVEAAGAAELPTAEAD